MREGASVVDARLWRRWKTENADQGEGETTEKGQASVLLKGIIPRATHRNRQQQNEGRPFLVEGPATAHRDTPLADLEDGKAIQVIGEIHDLAMLRKLMATERRPSVADALRAAIEPFTKADAVKS